MYDWEEETLGEGRRHAACGGKDREGDEWEGKAASGVSL